MGGLPPDRLTVQCRLPLGGTGTVEVYISTPLAGLPDGTADLLLHVLEAVNEFARIATPDPAEVPAISIPEVLRGLTGSRH